MKSNSRDWTIYGTFHSIWYAWNSKEGKRIDLKATSFSDAVSELETKTGIKYYPR